MSEHLKNFGYVKEQLTYLKTKVDIDNNLGLYDINILSESLFANILNDVYDYRLSNINAQSQGFPAVDLVDIHNKKVFQVTSTRTAKKIRDTINLWKEGDYKNFELNFFYIKNKPILQEKSLIEFEKYGVSNANLFDITDVLNIIESNPELCKKVFDTIKIHLDTLSFEFNIKNYFDSFESHLQKVTSNAFKSYTDDFVEFINSEKKVLEVYSSGGNGKSHLIYEFTKYETEYIPLIFKKNVNISEDLKKLPSNKKFLFIFDDIDRFLDTNVFLELLSYVVANTNIKLLISYRKASKSLVKSFYRKYNSLMIDELEIIWNDDNIIELIKTINPDLEKNLIHKLHHQFNNNPYLITQALNGNINSIKNFSLKTIEDAKKVLDSFEFSDELINELLFKLSITVPLHENNIEQLEIENIKDIMQRLESVDILRKLGKRYRFNPDIIGDLYLAFFIDEFGTRFEDILEKYLGILSHTVFTNISYALLYLENKETLNQYIENIIDKWIYNDEYSIQHLKLINRIVGFVPEKSFLYLVECTKRLKAQENEHIKGGFLSEQFTKVSTSPDFNIDNEAINLGSIEPIVAQLIYMQKNNHDCGAITIKNILDYLTSDEILNLQKPRYDNHSLSSILKKLFSPLRTSNNQIILDAIDIATTWIHEPYNETKIELFNKSVIKNLLSVSFEDNRSDGVTFSWGKQVLNIKHPEIQKIIFKVKDIVLEMLESTNKQILNYALEVIRANAYDYEMLNEESKKFYNEIKKEFLSKVIQLIKSDKLDIFLLSEVDEIALNILKFDEEENEALKILSVINRTDEFIFYQLIQNKDFIIHSFNDFYEEYQKQSDVKEWMFDSQHEGKYHNRIDEKFLDIVERMSKKYTSENIVQLLNSLDLSNWGVHNKLLTLLNHWFDANKDEIINVYTEQYQNIQSELVKNILKELLLKKGVLTLTEADITNETSIDDLKIYTIIIFKNFDESKIKLIDKLFAVIKSKDNQTLYMFVGIIASDIYFILKQNKNLIELFKIYIYKLLEIQFRHNFDFDSYLGFSLEIMKKENKLEKKFIDLLQTIIHDEEYKIEHHELEKIYSLLDINLAALLDNIYRKLISKKADGYYRYYFHHYMEYDSLVEVHLLSSFVKSYDDFLLVAEKVENYYNQFVEYEDDEQKIKMRIDLDWFFKHITKQEYLEEFFEKLYKEDSVGKIEIFYKIVPIQLKYIDIITKNMNILSDILKIEDLFNYLDQLGKIKSFSRSHMQNSNMILEEEKLFNHLYDNIESLQFRLMIKEKLKYIAIEKRREIEDDIERLMDK